MGILEILLTAVGLSMDASAVGMTNGMNEPRMSLRKIFLVALFYGLFQGLMPLIGYLCASLFAEVVASIAPYVALVLLGFIGGKMIFEACKKEDACSTKPLSLGTLTVQAIATSIDALAVGITLLAYDTIGTLALNVFVVCGIFCLVTFALTVCAIFIGKKVGCMLSDKAELVGGIILVCIGLKIFIEGIIVPLF
jgi:putative Mn2+ efflux pump MntP